MQSTRIGRVEPRQSMHGLRFTVPGQGYPFEATVRVSWPDGTYQFRLTAKGGKVVAADRCAEPNAAHVLDAFLAQLVGEG